MQRFFAYENCRNIKVAIRSEKTKFCGFPFFLHMAEENLSSEQVEEKSLKV